MVFYDHLYGKYFSGQKCVCGKHMMMFMIFFMVLGVILCHFNAVGLEFKSFVVFEINLEDFGLMWLVEASL